MKGQGNKKEDGVVVGDKDKNNISNNNSSSVEEEEEDEFETTTDDEGEEAEGDGEEEVGINASMVVNLSESQSQLNFNSFSFNNRTNPNDSTIITSSEEDSESNSPLASSRSAPPDIREYNSSSSSPSTNNTSNSSSNNNNNNNINTETNNSTTTTTDTDNTTSTIGNKEHNDNVPSTPTTTLNISTSVGTNNSSTGTFLNNEKPTFTSTPKHPTSTGILSQQVNGGSNNNNSNSTSTPTTTTTTTTTVPTSTPSNNLNNDNNIVNESGTIKKKLSVTFADIVKTGNNGTSSENINIPNKILDESDDDDEEEDNDDEEDFSESVYFSMGQTPPSANKTTTSNNTNNDDDDDNNDISINQRPLLQSTLINNDQGGGENVNDDNTSKIINDSSFDDVSVNNQSELDMASVSARLSGHDDSMVTLMNVSSCNASALSNSDVSSVRSLLVNNSKVCGAGDGPNNIIDDEAADEEVHKINANLLLPHTVTELIADNGVKVYVVGTAHFSEQSQKDVMETIQKLQPTLVVLELCHSRRNILTLDEETILRDSADMSLSKVKETIKQSGAVQGTLHLLLLSMSAQLTKKLGMAPGGEFRAAVKEARNIPGCLLLLGDRPIKVTLSRALAALSLGQKLKLAWQFLTSNEDITKDEIERCKEKDLLERMMMEMTGEFPAISRVFVNERDIYLAHSLWLAATSRSHRNHGGPVVGVVGMGHVSGIVRHWGSTTEEHIAELISIPEPTMTSIVVRTSLKLSFYALVGYGIYKITQRVFDYPPRGFIHNTLERLPELASKSMSRFR